MSFFQTTVTKKYSNTLDREVLKKAYTTFKAHFHNSGIQENIRNSKEEQYQEGFFRDLFVNILGYKLNPEPNFNLITENKNVTGSKKSDGAIIINGVVCAVIELKGTDTTDLSKIEVQAFGYKNNQANCGYVITSNFEKLWFYIDNAIDHLEFNLFTLSEAEFELLYLCLSFESIKGNIPQKIKSESLSQEDTITKKLYKDYSLFKRELHQNLVELNPEYDALTLFKKSQKLLDRFLFLFFAEDRNLLPPNSVVQVIEQWKKLYELDEYKPLYQRFKKYFNYLNVGYKGQKYDVFAYNGGLFKPDELLDAIKIDDELLYKHTLKLSTYDFASEIDVNILGHIFENSLNELDEIQAQLQGEEIEKSKTKRKKDGVFYTPKYITKYIVENTVGKLCTDKKAELLIDDADYFYNKKRTKDVKAELNDKLKKYQNWLLQLTICDPACGSGAFLNQALDFLINEHKYIDELQAKLFGDSIILNDVSKSILENNLFGVDLNEESVEIAKLSLWLRTAQPNRKLNDLNNNIKCGNSLIDDPEIAGNKAFNWQTEFPQVFVKKQKKAWHITTAIHDSRTSQRMIDYEVRQKRAMGTIPEPQIIPLTAAEETLIVEVISKIVIEDNLRVMAFNVCKDHLHLLLVCNEEEVSRIVQKIKAKTARAVNIQRGVTVPTMERAPLANAPLSIEGDAPLPLHKERGEKQNSLWTQKFGCKEITDDNQLYNTIEYIKNNRVKHELPLLPILQQVSMLTCLYQSYDDAFCDEYLGGFDVIIGNPPYVKLETNKLLSEQISKLGYETFEKRGDLYVLFVEKGFGIVKENGIISYIMPNKWLQAEYGKTLRSFFLKFQMNQLIDFGDLQIFEGATTYPCIFISEKRKPTETIPVAVLKSEMQNDFDFNISQNQQIFATNSFSEQTWVISSNSDKGLLTKLQSQFKTLKETINGESYRGVLSGLSEAFLIDKFTKEKIIEGNQYNEIIHPFLQGRDAKPYSEPIYSNYLLFFKKGFTKQNIGDCSEEVGWEWICQMFPTVANWLLPFQERGKARTDKGDFWWELRACDYYECFSKPKIMYQKFQVKPCFVFDDSGMFCNDSMWIIPTENKALLGVLNSKMGWWLIGKFCTQIQNGYQLIWKYFGQIPVPNTNNELSSLVEIMLSLNKNLQEQSQKFQRTIQRRFYLTMEHAPLPLSIKLQNWYLLDYKEFIAELSKQKIKLSLADEAEWEEYFLSESKKVQAIKAEIDKTDKEIDAMVYQLYELTDEEIKIVEGN
jgi:REP element-mobilizing transposase RayT/type I restriction-modification system DNA methylase subunit